VHPAIFEAFDRICRGRHAGGRVLEIGALPTDDALLALPALRAAPHKVGINLTRAGHHRDFEVVHGSANAMDQFPDASFDTVLSNATLEHDRYFWKTIAEIRRVMRPGGLVVLGVPGFVDTDLEERARRWIHRVRPLRRRWGAIAEAATLTYRVHNFPGDYWRFSTQAVTEVLLGGMNDVRVDVVLSPPRVIGSAVLGATPEGGR
jgi:SAM-dependent methyltransferase